MKLTILPTKLYILLAVTARFAPRNLQLKRAYSLTFHILEINKNCIYKSTLKNTFKYHVSCTDGKISVRINLLLLPIFPSLSDSIVEWDDGEKIGNTNKLILS